MALTIEPAVAAEIRDLLLRVDAASAAAAEAVRLAEEAEARSRAAEALALRMMERLAAGNQLTVARAEARPRV